MRCFGLLPGLVALVLATSPAAAQAPVAEPLEISEAGQEYLRTVGRRVDSDVAYYDPSRAAPELTTNQTPQARNTNREPILPSRQVVTAIAVLVLAAILFQVWRAGAPMSVSLRARTKDATRARDQHNDKDEADAAPPPGLAEVLAMADRNAALVELARGALTHVAGAHDIRWQTSWTARELLRRLPGEAAELLRPLVRTAEHVQFGHRDIGEKEFRHHADRIAPLFRGAAS